MRDHMRILVCIGLLLIIAGCYVPLHQRYLFVKEHNSEDFDVRLAFTFPENWKLGLVVKEDGWCKFDYLLVAFPDPQTYTDIDSVTVHEVTLHLVSSDVHINLEYYRSSDDWLTLFFRPTQECIVPIVSGEDLAASFEVIIYTKHAQAPKHYFVEATLEETNKIEWKYQFID